VETTSF